MTTIVEGLPYIYDEKKIVKAWKKVKYFKYHNKRLIVALEPLTRIKKDKLLLHCQEIRDSQ